MISEGKPAHCLGSFLAAVIEYSAKTNRKGVKLHSYLAAQDTTHWGGEIKAMGT